MAFPIVLLYSDTSLHKLLTLSRFPSFSRILGFRVSNVIRIDSNFDSLKNIESFRNWGLNAHYSNSLHIKSPQRNWSHENPACSRHTCCVCVYTRAHHLWCGQKAGHNSREKVVLTDGCHRFFWQMFLRDLSHELHRFRTDSADSLTFRPFLNSILLR